MKLNAIKCLKCGDTVYSRALHDCRSCSCGACFMDGGQEEGYYRCGGNPELTEGVIIELDVTLEDLYYDWNTNLNKLGIIKESK